VPCGTRGQLREISEFRLQDCHLLWLPFPEHSATLPFCNSPEDLQIFNEAPHNPLHATPAGLHIQGLGCSPFARRYLGNRGCFLFLRVLRCFSSPCSLPPVYEFNGRCAGLAHTGFPIRRSPDQSLLAAPRSLSQLPTSFIASRRQGIHRTPLVA
jgi:hypothetical protein